MIIQCMINVFLLTEMHTQRIRTSHIVTQRIFMSYKGILRNCLMIMGTCVGKRDSDAITTHCEVGLVGFGDCGGDAGGAGGGIEAGIAGWNKNCAMVE